MIIDTQLPDPPTRRWPFLVGWSLATVTIVAALFLTHTPASQQASVAVSASLPPSTSASVSRSVIVQQLPVGLLTTMQRIDGGRGTTFTVTYLDNGGQRIAVGPTDNPVAGGTPDSQTTGLR